MSLRCLLTCTIFDGKSCVIIVFFPLYIVHVFSPVAIFNIFFFVCLCIDILTMLCVHF
jgi:hypothetical protein